MSRRRGGIERDTTSVDLNDDQVQELRAAFNLFSGGKDHFLKKGGEFFVELQKGLQRW
jgi:hypothetical protein